MPFRHVVMFEFDEHVDDEHIERLRDALSALPPEIEEIRSYVHGRDVNISEGNYDYVVVADFDNVHGFIAYRDHPKHVLVIEELIKGHVVNRAAVQYQYGAH